jgi:dTDP-glucose pyrophosphorylase
MIDRGDRLSRAVVLARGIGRRMREDDGTTALTGTQAEAATAGHKALMPIGGRPFLDYVLDSLATAGIRDVALVVPPDHSGIRNAYSGPRTPARVSLSWLVQPEPLGTANALLAAETWAGDEAFLAMNGDNLYPHAALAGLVALETPGLAAFDRDDLVASSNIPADRVAAFALVDVDARGRLADIVEKPSPERIARDRHPLVSMNLWRFDRQIFAACRDVAPSSRGEFELPAAVLLARACGVEFRAVRASGPVLDLSKRGDVQDVTRRLSHIEPRP